MDRTSHSPHRSPPAWRAVVASTLLATALACLVLLPLLGHRTLADWDEGIYAEVSREMLSGNWLVPHWNAQLWFEKPPLTLWITAVFFKLFGVTEFWARAGSAFSGVALVTLLHGWLALGENRSEARWVAWLSTLLLLSTFGFLHICRVGETDTLLSLACAVALIGLAELRRNARTGWPLFWIGVAIAAMTKGAASIVLLLTLLAFLAMTRDTLSRRNIPPFLLGLALFLAAVLPWHLFMLHRFGTSFTDIYVGLHVLHRATTQLESHHTPWWYYLKVIAVSAAPLLLLALPPVAATVWKRDAKTLRNRHAKTLWERDAKTLQPFAIFTVIVVLFFSLIQTRLPHYVAPVYPALAVLAASWWAGPVQRFFASNRSIAMRAAAIAAAIACFALSAWTTSAPRKHLHAPILGDGSPAPDSRESAALLKRVFAHSPTVPGPLLFWRQPHLAPIASSIFYARRVVQRVQPDDPSPSALRDPYMFDPQSFLDALADGPRLILLDRSLLTQLPSGYVLNLVGGSSTLVFGMLAKVPAINSAQTVR